MFHNKPCSLLHFWRPKSVSKKMSIMKSFWIGVSFAQLFLKNFSICCYAILFQLGHFCSTASNICFPYEWGRQDKRWENLSDSLVENIQQVTSNECWLSNKYVLKVNNRNTRKRCKRNWQRFGVFIVNFEHIFYLFLVFLLLTLNK